MKTETIKITEEFQKCLNAMEGKKTLLITGHAGTGKSTLLKYFREKTLKNAITLAPTGVAALNVNGQTIHSFCGFKPTITPSKVHAAADEKKRELISRLDTIIIDEVSMVRADLLDCLDVFLRKTRRKRTTPFGGIQMIFIGDLYQLPPVVQMQERDIFQQVYESEYFFSAHVFAQLELLHFELTSIFRQKDEVFIRILNAIRTNVASDELLSRLNARVGAVQKKEKFTVCLTPTNARAFEINDEHLSRVSTRPYSFAARTSGSFEKKLLPTEEQLIVKVGAQVMLLNNDPSGRWVNGSIGEVVSVEKGATTYDADSIMVRLANGRLERVGPVTWEMYRYVLNPEMSAIESEVIGSCTQYPLRLAWAVTIHKSQGKTFDRVVIDLDRGAFAHGQVYVALSRCTSLEGLTLTRPVRASDIRLDVRICDFFQQLKEKKPIRTLF